MYGYVNYPGGTIYADAVKDIDRTITENWKNDSIKYIKFGDNFQEMDRDAFLHMDNPDFYRECKIVCVNRYCMNLLYAPYWGKQR